MYKKDGNQITRITTKDTFKSVEGYKLMASNPSSNPTTPVVMSFVDTLIDNTIMLVIGVVLIILILYFYRKK